jgi:hypothetical protein
MDLAWQGIIRGMAYALVFGFFVTLASAPYKLACGLANRAPIT